MYESNPRVPPPPPRHLTRIKSRVGGNLTFVQCPIHRAFDTMKNTSQHLVYPNNMHQYQSRQQCKGLFSVLFCNHMSSVKYRKQEQILKILDTMNWWSQFYNVLKYQQQGTTPRLATRVTTSWILPRCMVQLQTNLARRSKNTKISMNKARYILWRICFFANSWSLMIKNLLKTLLSYKI